MRKNSPVGLVSRLRRDHLPSAHTILLFLGLVALAPTACGDGPTTPGDNGEDPTPYAHDRTPGASAGDLLSAETFRHLLVEVQYLAGAEPSAGGLDQLRSFLEARLNKPGGVEIRVAAQPIAAAPGTVYSSADIRALEAAHRTAFTSGDTLATYLIFVDGEYQQENVLGIAYNNTSTALFGAKIREYTGGIGQPTRATVEGTVANHEFGHIMGLVNNGSDMQTPHQDEPNGRHCTDDGCLMYYAVRTSDFLSNLVGGSVPTLDQNCLDDLRANGGK